MPADTRTLGPAKPVDRAWPSVSVIVPTYNGAGSVRECIASLLALDYPADRLQILIVDNGSTDNTRQIVSRLPVTLLIEDQRRGAYAARNCGLKHATGQIIAFTDDDCLVESDWLKAAVSLFDDAAVGVIAGRVLPHRAVSSLEHYLEERNEHDPCRTFTKRNKTHPPWAAGGNAFYRRQVFEQLGPFDDTMFSGGDVDMSWRAQLQGGFQLAWCPQAIVYHKHASNLRSFFKQQKRYGMGRVLIYQRHPSIEPPAGCREIYWRYRLLAERGCRLLLDYRRFGGRRGFKRFLSHPEVLRFIQRLAYTWGRLCGSVKFRTLYL